MAFWERPGQSDDWQTPAYIFDALDVVFDLDPAHPAQRLHVPARYYFSDIGLERAWHGLVWMNAPFGGRNGLAPWLRRFVTHGDGIALVPDRTSAPWFQAAAKACDAILFVSPKVKFISPDGTLGRSPATGTALLAIGAKGTAALTRASALGLIARVTASTPVQAVVRAA